jgi:membrane protease YdiL (CAAX protease family)
VNFQRNDQVLKAFVMLAVFPVIVKFPLNLVPFWWGFEHGTAPMPPEVRARERKVGRYLSFVTNAILIGIVTYFVRVHRVPASALGLHLQRWETNALIGVAAGFAWMVSLRAFLKVTSRSSTERPVIEELLEGTVAFWLIQFIIVDFAEEFWRAASLFLLVTANVSPVGSVGLTALAFGVGHLGKGIPRALGTATFGVAAAFLFLWSRSLVAPYLFHLLVSVYALLDSRYTSSLFENVSPPRQT